MWNFGGDEGRQRDAVTSILALGDNDAPASCVLLGRRSGGLQLVDLRRPEYVTSFTLFPHPLFSVLVGWIFSTFVRISSRPSCSV